METRRTEYESSLVLMAYQAPKVNEIGTLNSAGQPQSVLKTVTVAVTVV